MEINKPFVRIVAVVGAKPLFIKAVVRLLADEEDHKSHAVTGTPAARLGGR